MKDKDIRWMQRFSNYKKALFQFEKAVNITQSKEISDLEKQGLIQAFEFTHELAWNVMKDYFEYQGETDIHGSRNATRLAFQRGIVDDGHVWMEMIESRNQTSHTYNEEVANDIYCKAINNYYGAFKAFEVQMQEVIKKEESL